MTTPSAFIGKEPSLNQLVQFIQEKNITGDIILGVTEDKRFSDEYYNGQYFYFGLGFKMSVDEPFTDEKISTAIKINDERLKNDRPCNSMEFASVRRCEFLFQKTLDLIQLYYRLTTPKVITSSSLDPSNNS